MKSTIRFETVPETPSKIVCIGRNYVEHVRELGNAVPDEMVVFNKPNSAISETLMAAHCHEPLHYEGEICFGVLGGEFKFVGFGLDLTKRELQSKLKSKGLPWERAKAFDGSALFSDFVKLECSFESLELELLIDGATAQQGGVCQMMFKPQEMLKQINQFCRLEDYDIVMTGTPKGVGKVTAGSKYEGIVRSGSSELVRSEWIAS